MPRFKCPRPVYVNQADKDAFIIDYKKWKEGRFAGKDIFSTNEVKKEVTSGNEEAHEFLSLEHVVSHVFNRLDNPGKKNMAEVCRCWAKWFIIGTDTSKVDRDYSSQLARENDGRMVWLYREGRLVQRFCACTYRDTVKEKRAFHRRLEKIRAAEERYALDVSESSESEGYYDSA